MKTLKEKIIELKIKGVSQFEIAKQLNCSTGTVSYHCNPKVKENILTKKRLRNKIKKNNGILSPLLAKEINVAIKEVCWKHAEAICTAKLIEKGYEVFLPFNGGGEIDLIAFKDNTIYKVQIKSITPIKNYISLSLTRNSINYKKNKKSPYKNIDFFLIYDGTYIYKYENTDELSTINLRYKVPKNNQINGINMASDYIF